jgi:hypothetical protein
VFQVTSKSRKNIKLLSAVIGGSAVVAMGVLSLAFDQQHAGAPSVAGPDMNVGQTATPTTPSGAPAVSMAVPTIKGPAPLPSEVQGAMA